MGSELELLLLRSLCDRSFFLRNNSVVDRIGFSSRHMNVVFLALKKLFVEQQYMGIVAGTPAIRATLTSMGVDLAEYVPLLRKLRKVTKEIPSEVRAKLVHEFVVKRSLASMAEGILDKDNQGQPSSLEEIKNTVDRLVTDSNQHQQADIVEVNYRFSDIDYWHDDRVLSLNLDPKIDNLLSIGPGEIGAVWSMVNGGKTLTLCNVTCQQLRQAKTVLFVTADEPKGRYLKRIDQNLMDATNREINENPGLAEMARDKIKEMGGELIVLDFTHIRGNVPYIASKVEELMIAGVSVDMCVVDYPDKLFSPGIQERLFAVDMVYDDLARLGARCGFPVWVGSQVKREDYGFNRIDLASPSWSSGKAEKPTSIVAVDSNDDLRLQGYLAFHVIKSRAGKERPTIVMNVDFEKQRLTARELDE